MRRPSAAILLIFLLNAGPALAHGGGLNAQGCHTNRKTGDYHCHRSSSSASPAPRPQRTSPADRIQPLTSPVSPTRTFRNCTEARAAGAAPVRRGEPGYGPHLDRDNDGLGCE
ncbi:excalibur calcium-binding domain-containing protein [Hyphomonas pacifica]|jgi:hypothetical protein|uniref:excalibur calcium-binding domain-containing protein n=1 Tax=Hyphomonas pacifica TaxID=1280941 RepID=UPI000C960A41|nr:excalibur calcium-binding domain-containing protein [Hyphomonas pacifica]MAN45654.1 calcium-binding protein [Hyphomonas sp.]MBR9806220.1 excalibur calcium-binding domain-containing protein [Alphaproteobacteria bacterium]